MPWFDRLIGNIVLYVHVGVKCSNVSTTSRLSWWRSGLISLIPRFNQSICIGLLHWISSAYPTISCSLSESRRGSEYRPRLSYVRLIRLFHALLTLTGRPHIHLFDGTLGLCNCFTVLYASLLFQEGRCKVWHPSICPSGALLWVYWRT